MAQDPAARIAALEAELERVRAEAETERERFERRLRLAQNALPERRDARTVTQNIAAQQEIEALRGALRERDRVVKELTEQVRSLEDQLEDSYRQLDAVRRELGQRDEALADARRQAELAARRATSPPPPAQQAPAAAVPQPARPVQQSAPRPVQRPPAPVPPKRTDAVTLVVGLLVGALLACAVAVGLWWTGHWPAAPEAAALADPAGVGAARVAAMPLRHGG